MDRNMRTFTFRKGRVFDALGAKDAQNQKALGKAVHVASRLHRQRFCRPNWISVCLFWLFCICLSVTCGSEAVPRCGHPAQPHVSDRLFESGKVLHLELVIGEKEAASLRRHPRDYVVCTLRMGKDEFPYVALRLKGGAGSFQHLDKRPSFTLNTDKFHDGQKFFGLDKLHLNNSSQDPTYLKEWLCARLFLKAGVPTARATHALVEINGRRLGLYVLKEGYDKTFLKRHFTNHKGNLYDGGDQSDILAPLELERGDGPQDRSDLSALVKACQTKDPNLRFQIMTEELDVACFCSFLAMEIMTWHWDGYAMKGNNYRLYSDPSQGGFVFIPHGMDQMFWQVDGPIYPQIQGIVARAFLQTDQGKAMYRHRLSQLTEEVFQPEALLADIDPVEERIAQTIGNPEQERIYRHHVDRLRRAIKERYRFLNATPKTNPNFTR